MADDVEQQLAAARQRVAALRERVADLDPYIAYAEEQLPDSGWRRIVGAASVAGWKYSTGELRQVGPWVFTLFQQARTGADIVAGADGRVPDLKMATFNDPVMMPAERRALAQSTATSYRAGYVELAKEDDTSDKTYLMLRCLYPNGTFVKDENHTFTTVFAGEGL
ncbi:hypothetical protein [Actinomadura atramentaria]|uniref:hypothetical protein n=1 Tax=Actinomadura atramentaria TaxID=1990 RepID=UPI00037E0884|nr:hypothetical protein [Actinomadura atramentaria]